MTLDVMTTTLGAEGIDVVHDEQILLADTATDFAAAVVALLDDPGRRARLGTSARRLAIDQYSWESSADQFDLLLEHGRLMSVPRRRSTTAGPTQGRVPTR